MTNKPGNLFTLYMAHPLLNWDFDLFWSGHAVKAVVVAEDVVTVVIKDVPERIEEVQFHPALEVAQTGLFTDNDY